MSGIVNLVLRLAAVCAAVSPEALQSALAEDGIQSNIGFGSGDSSSNFGAPSIASTYPRGCSDRSAHKIAAL